MATPIEPTPWRDGVDAQGRPVRYRYEPVANCQQPPAPSSTQVAWAQQALATLASGSLVQNDDSDNVLPVIDWEEIMREGAAPEMVVNRNRQPPPPQRPANEEDNLLPLLDWSGAFGGAPANE